MVNIPLVKIKKQIEHLSILLERQGYCYDISKLYSVKKYDQVFSLEMTRKKWEDYLRIKKNREKTIDLYIHIPFCHSKCSYCVYPSWPVNDKKIVDNYIDYLIEQAKFFHKIFILKPFHCIYLGGGTPNILSYNQLNKLLSAIFKYFKFDNLVSERTCEFNPTWADLRQFRLLKKFGFNRISFGAQSLTGRTLIANNRSYQSYDSVKKAIKMAKRTGFEKINVDLMIGFPTEKPEDFISNFKKIAQLNPSSIIVYGFHPPERCLSSEGMDRQVFFQKKYPLFVKKVIKQMPKLCREVNFCHEPLDSANFHWGFRYKRNLTEKDLSNGYGGEFSKNTLGLGFCSRSHIENVVEYRQNVFQDKINYKENIFEGRKLVLRDEMLRFVVDSIDQKSEISLVAFKSQFGKSLGEIFHYAIYSLKKCKIIKEKKDSIIFYFREPKDKYIYTSFFVYEPEVE